MAAEQSRDGRLLNVAIVGPTASGKSALAIQVAMAAHPSSIFSMDAFQVYRGLDIGTGKLSLAERQGIPHYLLDVAETDRAYSVADYLQDAAEAMNRVKEDDGEQPGLHLWVGGTGLYFRALRAGLNDIPATDPAVRGELEAMPDAERVREVSEVDPRWAQGADLQNPHRVIRALAVYRQTGRPLSEWQQETTQPLVHFDYVFLLDITVEALKERITRRVQEMWEAGWPEEVQNLMKREGWEESSSARAIGYSEIAATLQGKSTREECIAEIIRKTWQYARRQRTWFRKEEGLTTLDANNEGNAETILSLCLW